MGIWQDNITLTQLPDSLNSLVAVKQAHPPNQSEKVKDFSLTGKFCTILIYCKFSS